MAHDEKEKPGNPLEKTVLAKILEILQPLDLTLEQRLFIITNILLFSHPDVTSEQAKKVLKVIAETIC